MNLFNLMNKKDLDINYRFKDPSLLERALSHTSISKYAHDNQRFEFLGDSLLSWCISEYLFENHPEVDEGQLNQMKSSIVSGKRLSQKAFELKINDHLKMSEAHLKNFGHASDSMLEDCFEALVAAILLDSNYTVAKEWILNTFKNELKTVLADSESENPKGKLQEWSQDQHAGVLPDYKLIASKGPEHEKIYTVSVFLSDQELGTGTASSIKGAEINAAIDALKHIQI